MKIMFSSSVMKQHSFLEVLVCLGCFFLQAEGKLCLKNDDIGYREGNIYFCNDPVLNTCCEEDQQFTCCEPTSNRTLRQQLQLWGCVALLVVVLLVLYFYFTNERDVLEGDNFKEAFRNIRIRLLKRQRHAHLLLQEEEMEEKKRKQKGQQIVANTGSPVKTEQLLNLQADVSH